MALLGGGIGRAKYHQNFNLYLVVEAKIWKDKQFWKFGSSICPFQKVCVQYKDVVVLMICHIFIFQILAQVDMILLHFVEHLLAITVSKAGCIIQLLTCYFDLFSPQSRPHTFSEHKWMTLVGFWQGFLHGFYYCCVSLPRINLTYIQSYSKKANFTYTTARSPRIWWKDFLE